MQDEEALSNALIAEILQEDIRLLVDARKVEEVQSNQVSPPSALADGEKPVVEVNRPLPVTPDIEIALALAAAEAQAASDVAYAKSLQCSYDASGFLNQQRALKLLAAEKKFRIDVEFAKKLGEMIQSGTDTRLCDAERYFFFFFRCNLIRKMICNSILGQDFVDQILVRCILIRKVSLLLNILCTSSRLKIRMRRERGGCKVTKRATEKGAAQAPTNHSHPRTNE